jgi:AraC-like DNA-binding protein
LQAQQMATAAGDTASASSYAALAPAFGKTVNSLLFSWLTWPAITGIGRAVGWADQNYFARRFNAHYGLSATTYRKRFASEAVHVRDIEPEELSAMP